MKLVRDFLTGKMVKVNEKESVLWPARVEPPHKMHREYILGLTKIFKKVIVIIGSANTHGEPRHCIPAITRYKMVVAMLDEIGLERGKYDVITMPDYYIDGTNNYDDEKWCSKIKIIADSYNASVIASGNEWVKKIFEENPKYNLKVIDPDVGITDTFRATDVRNMIIKGDVSELKRMVPFSVLQMLLANNCYSGVIKSSKYEAVNFLPGRQTVDMVLLLKDIPTGKLYVLLGKRKMDKQDFPGVLALPGGAIKEFELPNFAAKRVLEQETGFKVEIVDNCFLDDPVKFENIDTSLLTMKMVGIYSSSDPIKAGTRGGSSQCFSIFVEDYVDRFRKELESKTNLKDLEELDFYEVESISNMALAFQHSEMLEKAVYMSKAAPKIEIDTYKNNIKSKCICLVGGSGTGKSTAAYGIMYQLKMCGISCEFTGEFAKDEVYEEHLSKIINDQPYIIANQNRRTKRLVDYGVRYIISDAPLVISAYHAQDERPVEELAYYLFDKTDNFIIYMNKDENIVFENKGRLEDQKKSNDISNALKFNLNARGYEYIETTGSYETIKSVLEYVAEDVDDPKLSEKIRRRIKILEMEHEFDITEYN